VVINLDEKGYVKLYRKLLNNPIICKDGDYLSVWIYLLLKATHTEYPEVFKGEKIILQPGQLITGRKKISEKLSISESKVTRIINKFIFEHQIEQQTSNENRLITVLNWNEYQVSEQPNEQPVNNHRTTSEQPVNTNKNVKNDKNVINKTYSDIPELNKAILEFIEFRKKIKAPMTDRAIELLKANLNKLSNSMPDQIAILNQSIMNGWKGVFELKQDKPQQPKSTNRFNQFPQRNYTAMDYQALEKALIQNQRLEEEE
jgi:DNA-binding MarR family transcriptional regulator